MRLADGFWGTGDGPPVFGTPWDSGSFRILRIMILCEKDMEVAESIGRLGMGMGHIGDGITRVGRFLIRLGESPYVDEPIVEFMTLDGRQFGSVRLSTAREAIVIDLYESAGPMLGLPLSYDVNDWCLNSAELAELREWARRVEA